MVILEEYNTAYITLSQDELDANNFQKGDTEGFVNYGLTLKGINFAVIFYAKMNICGMYKSYHDSSLNSSCVSNVAAMKEGALSLYLSAVCVGFL